MTSVWFLRRVVRVKHHPSAVLLVVQLLGVPLYALVEGVPGGAAMLATFGLLVLGTALQLVRSSPWMTWPGGLLAALVVLLLGINAMWPTTHLDIAAAAMLVAFYLYAAGSLIAYMLEDQSASADEFFAVGATFTLLAWAFAHLYDVCQGLAPGSFVAMVALTDPRTWLELPFPSFTVLSGVGLGDLLPVSPIARALVMIEELAVVMYIALVVSRLIALSSMARLPRHDAR